MTGHHKPIQKLTLRIPEVLLDVAKGRAGNDGLSLNEYIVSAVAHYNTRGSSDALHNRELSGFGKKDAENPLSAMEWALARRPLVADLQDSTGTLDKRIVRHVAKVLTKAQSRRFLLHLKGHSYTEIANFEEVNPATGKPPIKQAICKSIQQAEERLKKDATFRDLLVTIAKPKARETWYEGEIYHAPA